MARKEGRGEEHGEGGDNTEKVGDTRVQDCKSPVIDLKTYSSSEPQEKQKIWTIAVGVSLYETNRYEIVLHACYRNL